MAMVNWIDLYREKLYHMNISVETHAELSKIYSKSEFV